MDDDDVGGMSWKGLVMVGSQARVVMIANTKGILLKLARGLGTVLGGISMMYYRVQSWKLR